MTDREKVIRAVDSIFDYWLVQHRCLHSLELENVRQLKADALALLKEQEAVKPIKPLDKDDDFTFICSNCKGELFCGDILRDNFCPTCGRAVKWE